VLKGAGWITPAHAAVVQSFQALEDAGLRAGVVNLVFGDPSSISTARPGTHRASGRFSLKTKHGIDRPVGKQLAERAATESQF
jgi:hypothetical protein